MHNTTIKERIKARRKELNLTQKQLADLVCVSPQVISNWERGYTPEIGNDDLSRLASALKTTADYLLGNDQHNQSSKNNNSEVEQLAKEIQNNPKYLELHRLVKDMPDYKIKEVLNFAKYTDLKGKDRGPADDDDF